MKLNNDGKIKAKASFDQHYIMVYTIEQLFRHIDIECRKIIL